MKNLKKKITATISTAIVALTITATSALAYEGLHPNGKEWYIPKLQADDPNEGITANANCFTFNVSKILNGRKKSCNYKKIRIRAVGNKENINWYTNGDVLGWDDHNYIVTFKAEKGTTVEAYPDYEGDAEYKFYYFGNNPSLDAYATIESDCEDNWY